MMKGMDILKRKTGSIRRVIKEAPATFQKIGEEWCEEWLETARQIAPEDTGEYKEGLEYEVTPTQITLKATAPHSDIVEHGSSNHIAHATVQTAHDRVRPRLSQMTRDHFNKELK